MTHIHGSRQMNCPFSATIEFLEKIGSQHLVGPFSGVRTRVQCAFEETLDHTDETRRHQAMLVHWKAPSRLLPLMSGLITVRPHGPTTELRMDGSYVPPLGVAGGWFDSLIGRHLAQRTVDRFLASLCEFLNQAWQADRLAHAAPTYLP